MNILIVGNGFDLSHYLPTKYDHFMDVMEAIENKNTGGKVPKLDIHTVEEWMVILDDMFIKSKNPNSLKFEMNFDELFSKIRDEKFIEKTKKYYSFNEINLSAKDVLKTQYRLEMNCWYQYFKDHVKEIKTWIDFEQQIENALKLVSKYINKIDSIYDRYGNIGREIRVLNKNNIDKDENIIYVSEIDIKFLMKIKFIIENPNYGKALDSNKIIVAMPDERKAFICEKWFNVENNTSYGLSKEKYINFLNKELDDFIKIFNIYLVLIINKLRPCSNIQINSIDWIPPQKIYSFNYTNTYQQIYDSVDVEYLHGSHGESQNIVLGISDIEDESLRKLKAYGFTKYHQKLFKDTDYLFLDEYKSKISENTKKLEAFEREYTEREKRSHREAMISSNHLNLNIKIWGHSLDISDQDYITDLFSLNDDIDSHVRVTVFFYDKTAKFSLLNNLLAILGKDKVEQWMKNGWLKFEENPKINFGIQEEIEPEKEAS